LYPSNARCAKSGNSVILTWSTKNEKLTIYNLQFPK
jgi:hypothetical protein